MVSDVSGDHLVSQVKWTCLCGHQYKCDLQRLTHLVIIHKLDSTTLSRTARLVYMLATRIYQLYPWTQALGNGVKSMLEFVSPLKITFEWSVKPIDREEAAITLSFWGKG